MVRQTITEVRNTMASRLQRGEATSEPVERPEVLLLDVSEIEIGDRIRSDPGDIESLAKSIKKVGLLHPVVVRRIGPTQYKLIAGHRRMLALGLLERPIPVVVAGSIEDELKALLAENEENVERKDFTPTEAARCRDAVAEAYANLAKQRQREGAALARVSRTRRGESPGQRGRSASRNLREAKSPGARHQREVKAMAAKATGYSARTLDKVDEVRKTAEDRAKPPRLRRLARQALQDMDTTGKVDRPWRDVRAAQTTTSNAGSNAGSDKQSQDASTKSKPTGKTRPEMVVATLVKALGKLVGEHEKEFRGMPQTVQMPRAVVDRAFRDYETLGLYLGRMAAVDEQAGWQGPNLHPVPR